MSVGFSDTPDGTDKESEIERILNESQLLGYPEDAFPLADLGIQESEFLVTVRNLFGTDISTPRELTNRLRELLASGTEGEVIIVHLFNLTEMMLDTLDHSLAVMNKPEQNVFHVNVLTLLHLYLCESIVPAEMESNPEILDDLHKQIGTLISMIAGRDKILYAQIKRLFSTYTRVGSKTTYADVFETVEIKAVNPDESDQDDETVEA